MFIISLFFHWPFLFDSYNNTPNRIFNPSENILGVVARVNPQYGAILLPSSPLHFSCWYEYQHYWN